jgi:hypothetical protein
VIDLDVWYYKLIPLRSPPKETRPELIPECAAESDFVITVLEIVKPPISREKSR